MVREVGGGLDGHEGRSTCCVTNMDRKAEGQARREANLAVDSTWNAISTALLSVRLSYIQQHIFLPILGLLACSDNWYQIISSCHAK